MIVRAKQIILDAVEDKRIALGLKQSDISEALERSQPFISQVFAGEHSHIGSDDLDALERLFSCQFVVVSVSERGDAVSLLELLSESSMLIPFVWQRILRLLELDVVIQQK